MFSGGLAEFTAKQVPAALQSENTNISPKMDLISHFAITHPCIYIVRFMQAKCGGSCQPNIKLL